MVNYKWNIPGILISDWRQLLPLLISVAVLGLSIWGFAELADELLENELAQVDSVFSRYLVPQRTVPLNYFFVGISWLGYEGVVIGTIAVVIMYIYQSRYRLGVLFAIAVSLGGLLNRALKELFERTRPEIGILSETGYSFPSGHTMGSVVFYGLGIFLIWQSDRSVALKQISSTVLICLVILIGYSRIYLGVHFLTDVVSALLAGSAYLSALYLFYSRNSILSAREQ